MYWCDIDLKCYPQSNPQLQLPFTRIIRDKLNWQRIFWWRKYAIFPLRNAVPCTTDPMWGSSSCVCISVYVYESTLLHACGIRYTRSQTKSMEHIPKLHSGLAHIPIQQIEPNRLLPQTKRITANNSHSMGNKNAKETRASHNIELEFELSSIIHIDRKNRERKIDIQVQKDLSRHSFALWTGYEWLWEFAYQRNLHETRIEW